MRTSELKKLLVNGEDKFLLTGDAGVETENEISLFSSLKTNLKVKVVPSEPLSSRLLDLRSVKSKKEADNIIKAQRIAEKAFYDILDYIKVGMTEKLIAATLNYKMMCYGAESPSFDTIVVSGQNSSLPHGVPTEKKIEKGDFITMDFGAMYNGYCSDMTRTVAVGFATDEMKKVYDTVLNAQLAGIDAAQAGRTGAEIDRVARDIISSAGYGQYFGHALGHGVGIEIHEEPKVSPSNGEVLPEGSVITIEPGIYIPGHFGVRIEDMLYIKTNGNTNLTNYPKNLIIL